MELGPQLGLLDVGLEGADEVGIVGDFATLDLMPGTVGRQLADRVVDVALGDPALDLVVEDGLERRDDLKSRLALRKP